MRYREIGELLQASETIPSEPGDKEKWLEGRDIQSFLSASTSEDVPIYLGGGHSLYLYAAFVPNDRFRGDWIKEGLAWNFSVPSGWGYGYRNEEDGRPVPTIYPPMDGTAGSLLEGAEAPIFWRCLEGRGKPYLELNQRFAHLADVHLVPDREAYCRLDENGDLENVVNVKRWDTGWVCTATKSSLDFFMFLTHTSLVRVFDEIRPFPSVDGNGDHSEAFIRHPTEEIFATLRLLRDKSGETIRGHIRGFQVIRCCADDETLWKMLRGERLVPKQYATFLISDWKNQRVVEWSCDPASLGNYFVESDLPYSTSPAFFRPEVLSKYKQDPDKYELDVRSVACRGAWELKSFDVNEAGQVHAFVGDLGHLPYSEQLHWKQFNEEPKAGISKRSFKTDFEGDWDTAPDPVWELRGALRDFPKTRDGHTVWSTRNADIEDALGKIQHVVTESKKEWRDSILDLSRLVIDGLETATLRATAKSLGCDDPKIGSLKLLKRILDARGVDPPAVAAICVPLEDLQAQRSAKAAHGLSDGVPAKPREDFRERLTAVRGSVDQLAVLVRTGILDLEAGERSDA